MRLHSKPTLLLIPLLILFLLASLAVPAAAQDGQPPDTAGEPPAENSELTPDSLEPTGEDAEPPTQGSEPPAEGAGLPGMVSGELGLRWGDGAPDSGLEPVFQAYLTTPLGAEVRLDFGEGLPVSYEELLALRGRQVEAAGDWIIPLDQDNLESGGELAAQSLALSPDDAGGELSAQAVTGSKAYISILCKFNDVADEPKNLAYFQGMYANAWPGLDHYWREVSYNNINLSGSGALGWYTLPQPRSYYIVSGSLNFDRAAKDCTAVADPVVNFNNYHGINLMFNAELDGYAWGGTHVLTLDGTYKAWPMTWEPPWGYSNITVIAHEMGHSFGFPHSHYTATYDNQWDVMSAGWTGFYDGTYGQMPQDTIAYHLTLAGWIPAGRVVTVAPGSSATLTLDRLNLPGSSNPLLVKAPVNGSATDFYTVEARFKTGYAATSGYDKHLPGSAVIIHRVTTDAKIPATLQGSNGGTGGMWTVGQTFSGAGSITISVSAATASTFTVTVSNNSSPSLPPATPANLRAQSVSHNSVGLAWDDVANESGYKLYKWGEQGGVVDFYYLASTGANATTYTDSRLSCNTDYFYQVSSYNANGESARSAHITVRTAACPPPANDDIGAPFVVSATPYHKSQDTTYATRAASDPALTACKLLAGNASVWYQYTPASSGTIFVDTRGSSYDTILGVWKGTPGSLTAVACNDDIGWEGVPAVWNMASALSAVVTAGTKYYLGVSQYAGVIAVAPEGGQQAAPPEAKVLAEGELGAQAGGALEFNLRLSLPPAAPVLTSPASNALLTNYTPLLDWGNAARAVRYRVQVATTNLFDTSLVVDTWTDVSNFTPAPLLPNTKYYWRVLGRSADEIDGPWSAVWYFRTAMVPPVLSAPGNGTTTLARRPDFDWGDVSGATSYTIQVSSYVTFSSTLVSATAAVSAYTPTADLPANRLLYWRVKANGANPSAWSAVGSFTTPNPPGIPALVSPASGALLYDYRPRLDWGNATLPAGTVFDRYQVQVATDTGFSALVVNQNVAGQTNSEYTLTFSLTPNTRYYWRVRAFNTLGEYSTWAAYLSFRTAMTPPVLSAPGNGTTALARRPDFDWGDVSGATSYTIQVSSYATFSSTLVSTTAAVSAYTPTADLPANRLLYWRVKANGANPSAWSAVGSFTTPNPPGIPALVSPASGALLYDYRPRLDWGNATLPAGTVFDRYQVQVATDTGFSALVVNQNVAGQTNSEYTLTFSLTPNTRYYWRVRAFNTLGQYSTWSAYRSLRTALPMPALLSPADGAVVTGLRPVFDWSDVPGATGYTIQVSAYATFSSLLVNKVVSASTYTPTANLPANKTLYWRVKANGTNPSAWAGARKVVCK